MTLNHLELDITTPSPPVGAKKSILFHMIDKMLLQTMTNHPVHIRNKEGEFSQSSFIPFCSFGEKFIGAKVDDFDIPVCNIFKPRNYLDQICYETDLQELRDNNDNEVGKQLELGLTLALDYNEERHINYIGDSDNKTGVIKVLQHNRNDVGSVSTYLNTISMHVILMAFD